MDYVGEGGYFFELLVGAALNSRIVDEVLNLEKRKVDMLGMITQVIFLFAYKNKKNQKKKEEEEEDMYFSGELKTTALKMLFDLFNVMRRWQIYLVGFYSLVVSQVSTALKSFLTRSSSVDSFSNELKLVVPSDDYTTSDKSLSIPSVSFGDSPSLYTSHLSSPQLFDILMSVNQLLRFVSSSIFFLLEGPLTPSNDVFDILTFFFQVSNEPQAPRFDDHFFSKVLLNLDFYEIIQDVYKSSDVIRKDYIEFLFSQLKVTVHKSYLLKKRKMEDVPIETGAGGETCCKSPLTISPKEEEPKVMDDLNNIDVSVKVSFRNALEESSRSVLIRMFLQLLGSDNLYLCEGDFNSASDNEKKTMKKASLLEKFEVVKIIITEGLLPLKFYISFLKER
jgi:hypothetical protein